MILLRLTVPTLLAFPTTGGVPVSQSFQWLFSGLSTVYSMGSLLLGA